MSQLKVVLAYRLTKEKEKTVQEICRKQNIRLKSVTKAFYNQPLGFLAGIAGIKKQPGAFSGEDFPEEMLVFCGLTGEALDSFLTAYKETGVQTVALKAIVTPHNIFWDSVQLFEELRKERQKMRRNDISTNPSDSK